MRDAQTTAILFCPYALLVGFQNIAANDAIITSKINTMSEEGWELAFVTSGVESNAGSNDSTGIFITRFVFKRLKK